MTSGEGVYYTYEARRCGVKKTITDMAFYAAGVRDIARVLKISIIIVTHHVFK